MIQNQEQKKERWSAYQKQRKQNLKDKGLCLNCEKNKAATGRTCCVQCLEDKKLRNKFGTAGPYRQLYGELFEAQNGLCSICQTPMKRPVLDHNHETMEVRGLLCSTCHLGLSQFKDSTANVSAALKYLKTNTGIGIKLKKR